MLKDLMYRVYWALARVSVVPAAFYAMPDPEESAEKWGRNLQGATEDIRRGVERVTTSPGQAAAAKADKWKARTREAMDDGRWERAVRDVPLDRWKENTATIGTQRIASGVQKGQPKIAEFNREFYPHLEQGQRELERLPDVTIQDGIERAAHMIRHNHAFKARRRRS